jgi:hypothetical protein
MPETARAAGADLFNYWLQATRGCALLFFLAYWPRVPEPKRRAVTRCNRFQGW